MNDINSLYCTYLTYMNNHSLNHLHTTTAYKFEQNVFVRGLLIAKIFMLMKVYSRFSFSTFLPTSSSQNPPTSFILSLQERVSFRRLKIYYSLNHRKFSSWEQCTLREGATQIKVDIKITTVWLKIPTFPLSPYKRSSNE